MPNFLYLTFVFFVSSRFKNIFEPRRRVRVSEAVATKERQRLPLGEEHEEKLHFYTSP